MRRSGPSGVRPKPPPPHLPQPRKPPKQPPPPPTGSLRPGPPSTVPPRRSTVTPEPLHALPNDMMRAIDDGNTDNIMVQWNDKGVKSNVGDKLPMTKATKTTADAADILGEYWQLPDGVPPEMQQCSVPQSYHVPPPPDKVCKFQPLRSYQSPTSDLFRHMPQGQHLHDMPMTRMPLLYNCVSPSALCAFPSP